MKHLIKGRRLNRNPTHRTALKRNLACRLFVHERIITTVAKAKELRPFAERLITIAKKGSAALEEAKSASGDEQAAARARGLAARRRLMRLLGGKKYVHVKSDRVNVVDKLLGDLGVRFRDRPGGYSRVIKRAERRLGDAAPTAFIELLKANEGKDAASPAPAKS